MRIFTADLTISEAKMGILKALKKNWWFIPLYISLFILGILLRRYVWDGYNLYDYVEKWLF